MNFKQSLGVAFRKHRNHKEISQMDLAASADIERSTISAIENGHQKISMEYFLRLCEGLNIDPRTVLDDALTRVGK